MKPARPAALVVLVVLHLALKGLLFGVPAYRGAAFWLEASTAGVVTPVVLAGILQIMVLAIAMFAVGGLRLRDVGLTSGARGRRQLLNALLVGYLLWALVQVVLSMLGATRYFGVGLNPALERSLGQTIGTFLDATLSSAFVEEVMYRGFLVPQVYLLARRWTARRDLRLSLAVALPQAYFGLSHMPALLQTHAPTWEVAVLTIQAALVGVLFAVLYLRTGNLYVVVAAHALVNAPSPVFVAGPDPALFALVGVCVLTISWPVLHRWFGDVFTIEGAMHAPRLRDAEAA